MGAETPLGSAEEGGVNEFTPPESLEFEGRYQAAVVEARVLIESAAKDDRGRIKDDDVRWRLADLMIELWPRAEGTKEEATVIQRSLSKFAHDVSYNPSMVKDFYYVGEQWPPGQRVSGKSFAQHSKLRGREDKAWALLGLNPSPAEDLASLEGLNKGQIRKVEKVLEAIDALDAESSAVLDAVVGRLKPKPTKARAIVAALRSKEKAVRQQAENLRKAKSPLAIIFDYQSHLLGAGARAQGLVELIQGLRSQAERDYVRTVIEGTVYVNQTALEDVLDALDEPASEHADSIEAQSEEARIRKALAS